MGELSPGDIGAADQLIAETIDFLANFREDIVELSCGDGPVFDESQGDIVRLCAVVCVLLVEARGIEMKPDGDEYV
jgi:hypothetical protein